MVLATCCWSAAKNFNISPPKSTGCQPHIDDISAILSTIRRNPKKLQITVPGQQGHDKSGGEDVY
jgi:hypothetical protein